MGKYRYNRYHDIEIAVEFLRTESRDAIWRSVDEEERKWEQRFGRSRGIESAVMWIRIPTNLVHVLPWLVTGHRRSFRMHHATQDYVMVVRGWRVNGTPNIPLYGTHYVRVECLVIEEGSGRVLMVSERVGAGVGALKLVTGSVGKNEFFTQAAEREVLEESGIKTSFVGMLGVANRLRTRFEKDEILVGALLFAHQGQIPRADGSEIERAAWVSQGDAVKSGNAMTVEWFASATSAQCPMPKVSMPDPLKNNGQLMEICAFKK